MTRATLLHVLERPTALGPAEVRELEQLAQAFPYCQTAHLLLAKAAHDQGTMLAGQRLRRAATYAADRTLLRRLIEQQEPAADPEPVAVPAAPHPLDLVDWPDEYVPPADAPVVAPAGPAAAATPAPAEALPPVVPLPTPAPLVAAASAAEVLAASAEPPAPADALPLTARVGLPAPEAELPAVPTPPLLAADVSVVAGPAATQVHALVPPAGAVSLAETPDVAPLATAAAETAVTAYFIAATAAETALPAPATEYAPPAPEPAPAAVLPAVAAPEAFVAAAVEATVAAAPAPPLAELPAASAAPEAAAPPVAAVAVATATVDAATERPAQAPAIRPPAEVGEARFEFGLADTAPVPAGKPTYELPGLVDEWAASAVTRGLGSPEALALVPLAPASPIFTPAAFTGDAVVGYAYGESSRLGLSMQLLDLLTAKAEAAESATAVVAAAQPPASALPPTGTFFEPDPLLLDHWATHRPVAPEPPSTLDLINNFLRRQPRLTRPAMLPPAPTHQADLSVRSTRAEPDLVSENLARIFVRQGKTARAIEIYEKLMVKQPEKMAYFAAQIQSLQPSA